MHFNKSNFIRINKNYNLWKKKNLNYKINSKYKNSNKQFNRFLSSINTMKKFKNYSILDCKKLFYIINKKNSYCIRINNKISYNQINNKAKNIKQFRIFRFFINTKKNNGNKLITLFKRSFYTANNWNFNKFKMNNFKILKSLNKNYNKLWLWEKFRFSINTMKFNKNN